MDFQTQSQYFLTRTTLTICIFSLLSLSACTSSNKTTEQPNKAETAGLTDTKNKAVTSYSLVQSDKTEDYILHYINQSITQQVRWSIDNIDRDYQYSDGDMSKSAAASTSESVSGSANFSSTNLMERHVDEADFVKQDKDHIYLTSLTSSADEQGMKDTDNDGISDYETLRRTISIYQKPKIKPEQTVGKVYFNRDATGEGIYLVNDTIITTENVTSLMDGSQFFRVNTFDISNLANPKPVNSYALFGELKQSRKINDNLYVVSETNLQPMYLSCDVSPKGVFNKNITSALGLQDSRVKSCTQEHLLTTETLQQRLPKDLNKKTINLDDCYVPKGIIQNDKGKYSVYNTKLTLINKIDLTGDNHQTVCFFGDNDNFYMGTQAMYFANPQHMNYQSHAQDSQGNINSDMRVSVTYQLSTLIHKFGLATDSDAINSGNIKYAGTGKVDGEINWEVPSFSMNEHKGVLRVVTTGYNMTDGSLKNMIHTLKESDDELALDTLATLPNKEHPKPLGKPNEHIKGVRFMGDQGYIVTFKNSDPLYKIDLSNPQKIQMIGELEMPGYSAYLHRISEKYLMGIGYTVNERAVPTGIQTTIFDITSVPKIIAQDTVAIEDRDYQPEFKLMVDNDSKALSIIAVGDTLRVTIPYLVAGGNDFHIKHQDNGYRTMTKALEYEIDQNTGKFVNRYRRDGQLLKDTIYDSPKFRALIHANDLYYVTDDGVINKYEWGK